MAKIYIAGPMTGLPDYNFPAFHEAACYLRNSGHDPLNPATSFDGRQDLEYEFYIREASRMVAAADCILMLPGWHKSKGANMELHMALVIGMPTFYFHPEIPDMESVPYDRKDIGMNLIAEFLQIPDGVGVYIDWDVNEDRSVGEDEIWEEHASTATESDVQQLDYSLLR